VRNKIKEKKMKKMEWAVTASLLVAGVVQAGVVANIGADYATASGYGVSNAPTAAPTGWAYLSSDAATGGTESALTAETVVGNVGNTGFGVSGISTYNVGVLGNVTAAGQQYELFDDGYDGNGGNRPMGNEGVVGTDLLLQPGDNAGTEYMIVRYTFSAADILNGTTANISGSFRELTGRTGRNTDSITASVYLNTASQFSVVGGTTAGTDGYLTQADGTFNITGLTVAEGDSVSFVVFGNGNATSDETALRGSIEVIPEPATLGMVAIVGGGLVFIRRRFMM
jgi:hypothetical protein